MGLLGYGRKELSTKILLTARVVKGKIAFGNSLGFQSQIDDLHLNCCILGDDSKNNISGRNTCEEFDQLSLSQYGC